MKKPDKPVIFRSLIRIEHQLQCKLVIFTVILGIKVTEIFIEQAIAAISVKEEDPNLVSHLGCYEYQCADKSSYWIGK